MRLMKVLVGAIALLAGVLAVKKIPVFEDSLASDSSKDCFLD